MGEISDYYIDKQLGFHPGSRRRRNSAYHDHLEMKRERQKRLEAMDDETLQEEARVAINEGWANGEYIEVAKKILSNNYNTLTQKQRNCLMGLMTIKWG